MITHPPPAKRMKHSYSDDSSLIVTGESAVSAKERREDGDVPPLPLPAAILNMFKEQGASNTIIVGKLGQGFWYRDLVNSVKITKSKPLYNLFLCILYTCIMAGYHCCFRDTTIGN